MLGNYKRLKIWNKEVNGHAYLPRKIETLTERDGKCEKIGERNRGTEQREEEGVLYCVLREL